MVTTLVHPQVQIIPTRMMEEFPVEEFVVAYAKIVTDKDDGIILQGVYFGGIGSTMAEAEEIARECVNTIRGGTILPRVIKLDGDGLIIDALYEAAERFDKTVTNMNDANKIVNAKSQRKAP